jgi:hypothetical protein
MIFHGGGNAMQPGRFDPVKEAMCQANSFLAESF